MNCTNCHITDKSGQWWGLSNYFGISGWLCPDCYELVSHDSYKKPQHPEAYQAIKDKQTKENQ